MSPITTLVPPMSAGFSIAYDDARQSLVMFGGILWPARQSEPGGCLALSRSTIPRQEIALRAWREYDLARVAGITTATLSTALHGRSVSASTLRKIAQALGKTPVIPGLGEHLEAPTDAGP
jgi:DNA-binding Xre family transcriptional regulator